MTRKTKKSDTGRERVAKGSGLSWQGHTRACESKHWAPVGPGQGHSCQMGPGRNTWLPPKECGVRERMEAPG